ncbi:MAG: hypothetical protein EPO20_26575 [Betaproteobacteria bacterium]|nr:MAG: hypothetical protein EPO20_26575 [Betaproteobacteria bacterium]
MRLLQGICVAAALAAAGSAQAAGIGVRAGTTGVGADVAWSVAPALSARIGYSALNWNKDVSTDRVTYDGKLKLSNLNTFLDFSPLGPFRLTGGFIFNNNRYDVRGDLLGGSVSGDVKAGRSAAPYLGIGYGNVSGLGVNFYADLGIMFQGSPRARLAANCGGLSASGCTALQNEVAAEQQRLEDKLKDFKYYPVANIGITIGF